MTWTDLSGAFGYGTKLTSSQMQQLRDNITALANGDAGAPAIQSAALDSSIINQAALKTSTGSISGTGSGSIVSVVMQDYCFFPSIWKENTPLDELQTYETTNDPNNTAGRFSVTLNSGDDYAFRYRYVTSSDKPFLYAIKNPTTGEIKHIWACEDPPPDYWGLDAPPVNFVPPLIIADQQTGQMIRPDEENEIIIFNYDLQEYHDMIDRSEKDKKLLHRMLTDEYELKSANEIFTRKNLSMI